MVKVLNLDGLLPDIVAFLPSWSLGVRRMELQIRLAGRYWGATWHRRFDNGVQNMQVVEDDESDGGSGEYTGKLTLTWTAPDGRIKTRRFKTERGLLRMAARVAGVSVRSLRIRD